METSEKLTGAQSSDRTCLQEASPANQSVLQESGERRTMSGGYGLSLPEPFAYYDPDTSSWKTCQGSFSEDLQTFSGTWPQAGTMRTGRVYRQRRLVPRTSGRGSGLWPTPGASKAANDLKLTKSGDGRKKPNKLGWMIVSLMYPTLTTADSRSTRNHTARRKNPSSQHSDGWTLVDVVDGLPNPTFAEWLMGYPIGWTEIETQPSETQSFPK